MNWASARSSRAKIPTQHDKARARKLAGAAKVDQPEPLADRLVRAGAKLNRGGSPARRSSRFAVSSAPSGTSFGRQVRQSGEDFIYLFATDPLRP